MQAKARGPPKGQTAAADYSNLFFKFEYRAFERSFEYSIFLGQPYKAVIVNYFHIKEKVIWIMLYAEYAL